jgi:peptidoglycan hydrolase-like protein with peptidoglycan-binding domain
MTNLIGFKRGDKTPLTANFSRSEFQCSCGCSAQMIDEELAEKLQTVRDKLGVPLTITSGYRCLTHNNKIGGSKSSKHLYGLAADWRTKDGSINPVALGIVAAQTFDTVGIYWYGSTAFVHTDTRNGKVTWLCTAAGQYRYTTAYPFILPTVRKGSVSAVEREAVKMLQHLLGLTVDGSFGDKTEQAVKNAQEEHGLQADGICGPSTWKAISGANKYLG